MTTRWVRDTGLYVGFARLTFHVFPGTDEAKLYPNGGCRWQEIFEEQEFGSLNLSRECRQLDVSGEQEGQISGGNVNAGNKELEQTAERNNGEAMDWRSRTRERTRGWMR